MKKFPMIVILILSLLILLTSCKVHRNIYINSYVGGKKHFILIEKNNPMNHAELLLVLERALASQFLQVPIYKLSVRYPDRASTMCAVNELMVGGDNSTPFLYWQRTLSKNHTAKP